MMSSTAERCVRRMTILARGFRLFTVAATVAVVVGLGNASLASISQQREQQSHRSLLHAKITLADGADRALALEGVGCNVSMCSRVAIRTTKVDSVWLDGLASVTGIAASDSAGPVKAIFHFGNGAEREASITGENRVLYLQGRFGRTEKLDLGGVVKIDFE